MDVFLFSVLYVVRTMFLLSLLEAPNTKTTSWCVQIKLGNKALSDCDLYVYE